MNKRFKDKEWVYPTFKDKGHNRWKSEYGWNVWHLENLKLGKNTDIGYGTLLFAHNGITIEDDVQISSSCSIYSINTEDEYDGEVIIKKGAYIGAKTIIFPGIIIKENEKIKAGCIIYRDQMNRRIIKEPNKKLLDPTW